jgi:hypothetical protein
MARFTLGAAVSFNGKAGRIVDFWNNGDGTYDAAVEWADYSSSWVKESTLVASSESAIDAGMRAHDAAIDAEMGAAMEEAEEEIRSLSALVHAVTGEDVNGMKGTTYKYLCDAMIDDTEEADRYHFYTTGLMVGTVATLATQYR